MKKITIYLDNNPIAMFTYKGSFKNAERQAAYKIDLLALRFKSKKTEFTYLIR